MKSYIEDGAEITNFLGGGVNSRLLVKPLSFAEFGWAHCRIFSEFLVEVIHVLIADLFRNLIYFQPVFQKKLFGVLNAFVIHVGIEAFPPRFL